MPSLCASALACEGEQSSRIVWSGRKNRPDPKPLYQYKPGLTSSVTLPTPKGGGFSTLPSSSYEFGMGSMPPGQCPGIYA